MSESRAKYERKERDRAFSHIKDFMIEFMEKKGTAPWHSSVLKNLINLATRGSSGLYHGINQFLTGMYMILRGWDSNIFLTCNQIKKQGGFPKKGEKACYVVHPVILYYDENKKRITEAQARELRADGEKVSEKFVGWAEHAVFNLAQTTLEYEHLLKPVENEALKNISAEEFVKGYADAPRIVHEAVLSHQCDGYYSPVFDEVHLYPIGGYDCKEHYYKTLFHELIHSTEHEKRLNMKRDGKETNRTYAFYELRAEIGANLAMTYTDMDYMGDLEHSSAYVKYWINRIKTVEDFQTVLTNAFNSATRAVQYITGEYKPERIVEEEVA